MPNQTANLTALAADGNAIACYMSVVKGNLVMTGAVSATPGVDGVVNLSYTVSSGSASAVKPGMRVDIYRSNGTDFKGRTRIRYAGTISPTNLPIRENAKGAIYIVAGDIVRVYDDVREAEKLVAADETFAPDQLSYSDEGSNPPPVVNSGGAWAGWDTMLPIPFTGSTSFTVDPDSAGTVTHSWSWPTGLTADSTTDADPEATDADAGEYEVAHTGTDASNSKSRTQYTPVVVHDAAHPPYSILLETPDGSVESGWRARVRIFEDATLADIPDGARVIVWKEEYLNGTRQSLGAESSGRSHIILDGIIRREEGDFDAETGVEEVWFEIISPLARLEELMGYSKVMLREASPDGWNEIKGLTTKRAIIQLVQFYTNLNEAGYDLTFTASYRDKNYPALYLQESTPYRQIVELADGTAARFVCLMGGRFLVYTKGERKAIGDRAAATRTLTITPGMYLRRRYTREHWTGLNYAEVRGFIAATTTSGATPVFSRYYGNSPGQGTERPIEERRIVDSQSDANAECGRFGASSAGEYVDANGTRQQAVDLEYDFPSSYAGVFDFYDEYVDVDDTTDVRGLDLSGASYVLVSSSFGYDNETGTGIVTVRFRTATNGLEGQTYVPPTENDSPLPPYTPPDFDFPGPGIVVPPPPIVPIVPPAGSQTLGAWTTGGYFIYCGPQLTGRGFDVPAAQGGPLWARYGLAALGMGGSLLIGILDAQSPSNQVNACILSTTQVRRHLDVFNIGGSTLDTAFTLTGGANASRAMQSERGEDSPFVVSSFVPGAGSYVARSDDRGATWSEAQISTFRDTSGAITHIPGVYVYAGADKVLTSAFTSTAIYPNFTAAGYQSTNGGAFAVSSNPNIADTGDGLAHEIHVPFQRESENVAYYGHWVDGPGALRYPRLYRVVGGGTPEDISPTYDGQAYGPTGRQFGIKTCDIDPLTVFFIGMNDNSASVKIGGFLSRDGGDTWTTILTPTTGLPWSASTIAGDNRNLAFIWGNTAIGVIDLSTGVIDDRSGNLATDFPDIGYITNIVGLRNG
jgi:hypothetical protein